MALLVLRWGYLEDAAPKSRQTKPEWPRTPAICGRFYLPSCLTIPEVEAAIRDTIGQTCFDLELYPQAQKQLELALELHWRAEGFDNPKTVKTISRLAQAVEHEGNYSLAEALFGQGLEIQRRVLGPQHPDTPFSSSGLADVYYDDGKYVQAEAVHSRSWRSTAACSVPIIPIRLSL